MANGLVTFDRHDSYDKYVAKQKEKTLDPMRIRRWQNEEWKVKYDGFRNAFERNSKYLGERAICLGSRTGQEVAALRDMGIDAVGIDLVAFPPYTVEGDIHDLKYQDGEFQFAFTNVFDHALYPDKFVSEIERVCSGYTLMHLQLNTSGDEYSENKVSSADDVVGLFKKSKVVSSKPLNGSFDGMNWELVVKHG